MPYLNARGYCRDCKRVTPHRFSLKVVCKVCALVSSQELHRESEEAFEKQLKEGKHGLR